MGNPTRSTLVDACKALIAEAYTEATAMIVAYLELHPKEATASLCKDIDPENWNALRTRVQRLQEKRRLEGNSDSTISAPTAVHKGTIRGARSTIRRHPEMVDELLKDPEVRGAVTRSLEKQRADRADRAERISTGDPIVRGIDSRHAALDLIDVCNKAWRQIGELLMKAGELPDTEKPWLREAVHRLKVATDHLEAYVETGHSHIDREIAALLEGAS